MNTNDADWRLAEACYRALWDTCGPWQRFWIDAKANALIARHIAAARAEGRAEGVKEGRNRIAAILKDNSDAYQRRADSTSWYAKETNQEVANALRELAAELEKEPT